MGFWGMTSYRFFILAGILAAATAADGYVLFEVGGENGWVVNPSENYNHWAQRSRFQIHDTLYFKYNKGENSVLMVTKEDYKKCNTNNPIVKMDVGDSYFTLDRSGPFYFISGQDSNCLQGQKLIVVVLSPRCSPPAPPSTTPRTVISPSPAPNGIEPAGSNYYPSESISPATSFYPSGPLISLLIGFGFSIMMNIF